MRTVPTGSYETELPLHVAELLSFVPDDILDGASSCQVRVAPAVDSPLKLGGFAASDGAGRAMEVERPFVRPVSRQALP